MPFRELVERCFSDNFKQRPTPLELLLHCHQTADSNPDASPRPPPQEAQNSPARKFDLKAQPVRCSSTGPSDQSGLDVSKTDGARSRSPSKTRARSPVTKHRGSRSPPSSSPPVVEPKVVPFFSRRLEADSSPQSMGRVTPPDPVRTKVETHLIDTRRSNPGEGQPGSASHPEVPTSPQIDLRSALSMRGANLKLAVPSPPLQPKGRGEESQSIELEGFDLRLDQRTKVLEAHKARVAGLRADEAAAVQFKELVFDFNRLVSSVNE